MFICSACDRSDDSKITVYRIPKETPPAGAPQGSGGMQGAPVDVHWTAPSGWVEQPASGFRKGSFLVTGTDGKTADVSVISFPEAAGGLLANVNRWRNQLKLEPLADETKAATPLQAGGSEMAFVDLVSTEPIAPDGSKTRILGGIFPQAGETWFFKMMGPDALVEAQRDAFKEFLQSVHASHDGAPHAPVTAKAGVSTNAPTPPPLDPPQGAPVHYTLPPGWQEKPLTPMRVASFNATAPDGQQTDVSIVSLAGMAGGELANVNRWRDQVKLGPIDEKTLQQSAEHIEANGHDFLMVDLVSEGPLGEQKEKQRILAAMLDEGGQSWFVKMTGEETAVAAQKKAFVEFLRSLKLPAALPPSE